MQRHRNSTILFWRDTSLRFYKIKLLGGGERKELNLTERDSGHESPSCHTEGERFHPKANGRPTGKPLGKGMIWSYLHFRKITLKTDLGDLENQIMSR